MSAAVEVFEVGQQQLMDLLGVGACVGDYVCVSTFGRFGYVNDDPICYVLQNQDIDSLLASFGYLCERDIWALGEGFTSYAEEYEVWHVVDDADLCLMWELDVAKYKLASGQAVWRVYECDMPVFGGTPVMELAVLPHTIYHLICRDATTNWVVSDDWYSDGHKFCEGLDTAIDNGYHVVTSDVFDQRDAVTIMMGDTGYELDEYDGLVFEVTLHESC